jgi:acyl-CoA thioester hydrolase
VSHQVQMRWRDLDGLGHVNHTVVMTYLEEGRDAWLRELGIARDGYVVAHCAIDYRREIGPDVVAVEVRCRAVELGRSSVRTVERLDDEHGNVLADAQVTLVLWDPRERRSRPLTEGERAAFAATMEALR